MEPVGDDSEIEAARARDAALMDLQEAVGDAEFVAQLIGDFLDGLGGQLDALRAAESDADDERLYRFAHTLRSNAATFGANRLAGACQALEQAAQQAISRMRTSSSIACAPKPSSRLPASRPRKPSALRDRAYR